MSWEEKLKRLQENLNLTQDGLASTLGITTRTLSDFMNPASDREPTGPIQKLIELLSNEMDSPNAAKKPQLNLVVIHGDFRTRSDQDAVTTIVEMHAAAGTQRNNEFHYVTVEPERDKKWAIEGLQKRRVQPHFFVCDEGLNSQEARDCYFTATTVWLASQAMRRDLARITLAADPVKFWPLARELKILAEVDVTFVREAASKPDLLIDRLLEDIEIGVADPSGRKFGKVVTLKARADQREKVTFGYIEPEQNDSESRPAQGRKELFFSWNHMLKDRSGKPELEIDRLFVGDRVSFGIGMNSEGPCATDVALVSRVAGAPEVAMRSLPTQAIALNSKREEALLVDILRDAVIVCADEDGWALAADIGNRGDVRGGFKARLQALKPGTKIVKFCADNPDVFETQDHGVGSKEASARVRLKPQQS
jgi:transcriptional regulator with XRE-family HTH domain